MFDWDQYLYILEMGYIFDGFLSELWLNWVFIRWSGVFDKL